MEQKKKYLKLGAQLAGKFGSYIKLGQTKNKDPKWNYTVQVRILEGTPKTPEEFKAAKVLAMVVNPAINMRSPGENAPDFIEKELSITLGE